MTPKTLIENANGWRWDALRYVGWRRQWREEKAERLEARAQALVDQIPRG